MARSMARGRRDTAEREIGSTAMAPRVAAWLVVAFCMTTLASVGLEHALALLARAGEGRGTPQSYDVFRLLPTWDQVIGVRTPGDAWALAPTLEQITAYEDALEDASHLTAAVLPRAQAFLSRVLGAGNEQVYLGRGGELFYRQDVDYSTGRGFLDPAHLAARAASGATWEEAPAPDPRPAIRALHAVLRERGISLLVAPIPVKPAVQNAALRRPNRSEIVTHNASYAGFVAGLRKDGIDVYDPTPDVRAVERPYLRTDSHWTPAAMEAVAAGIAQRVLRDEPGTAATEGVYRRRKAHVGNTGDVAAMLKLSAGSPVVAPEAVAVHEVQRSNGDPWRPDAAARVLLLGDSFTNIYSLDAMGWGSGAGLAEQLSYMLQEPVDRIALNAGGARAAREALAQALARGDDRLEHKVVVVYTFAVRELHSGDWRVFDMPYTPPDEPRVPAAEGVVSAIVAGKSMPPPPGSVPYPDCVIAFHATDIRPAAEAGFPADAVVFLWGMRDDVWTPAAAVDVGVAVRLRLTPWADVEGDYGSYSRRELVDEETWLLDVYWGEIVP